MFLATGFVYYKRTPANYYTKIAVVELIIALAVALCLALLY